MKGSIWLDRKLLKSAALQSLSKWGLRVYLNFLSKRQMEKVKNSKRSDEWVIKNNGEIVYPYAVAERDGIGRREFAKAIDELIEKGFLDIAHQGSGGRAGDTSKYFIDDRWKDYGKPTFKPAKKPRVKDDREGRGWAAFHEKNKSSVTKLIPKNGVSSDKIVTSKLNDSPVSSGRIDTRKSTEKHVSG